MSFNFAKNTRWACSLQQVCIVSINQTFTFQAEQLAKSVEMLAVIYAECVGFIVGVFSTADVQCKNSQVVGVVV